MLILFHLFDCKEVNKQDFKALIARPGLFSLMHSKYNNPCGDNNLFTVGNSWLITFKTLLSDNTYTDVGHTSLPLAPPAQLAAIPSEPTY